MRRLFLRLHRTLHPRIAPGLLTVFFLSGAAGLIYEVAWARLLMSLFGATIVAVTTVTAAYMAGLGIGGYLAGSRLRQQKTLRPVSLLRAYAAIEVATAIYALVPAWFVRWSSGLYATFYHDVSNVPFLLTLARALSAFGILLPATICLGATLPVLVAAVVSAERSRSAGSPLPGRAISWLYAANTGGAGCGTLLAGFWLIENLGVSGATRVGQVVQLAIGLLVIAAAPRLLRPSVSNGPSPGTAQAPLPSEAVARDAIRRDRPGRALVLGAVGVAGVVSLGLEILWTRLLVVFLGDTVYSFTAVLATMLVGIALGSALAGALNRGARECVVGFALALAGIGFVVLATVPVVGDLGAIHDFAVSLAGSVDWTALIAGKFVVAAAIVLLPALLMGAAFPLAARAISGEASETAYAVGGAYAFNTGGGVVGAFLASFTIIPLLGIERGIVLLGGIDLAIGGLILLSVVGRRSRRAILYPVGALAAIALIGFVDLPSITPTVVLAGLTTSGTGDRALIAYQEDQAATIAVFDNDQGERELNIDGALAAYTGVWDLRVHRLLADLPLLLESQPRSVLVVGYGMGVTTYSATLFPSVQRVDVVELSPGVIAMDPYFSPWNHHALENPKVHLRIDDGKNYLLETDQRYDVITSNAIHPGTSSGNAALYTRDFYESARRALKPNGLMCQWVPIHQLSREDLRSLVHTFQVVFPHSSAWFVSDFLLLVGGNQSTPIDLAQLQRAAAYPPVTADLRDGLDVLGSDSVYTLLGYYVMDERQLAAYSGTATVNSDDHPNIEFSAPRSAFDSHTTNLENLLEIQQYRDARPPTLVDAPSPTSQDDLARAYHANGDTLSALIDSYQGRIDEEYALYQGALRLFPQEVDARYFLKRRDLTIIDWASGGALDGTDAGQRWLDWMLNGSQSQ